MPSHGIAHHPKSDKGNRLIIHSSFPSMRNLRRGHLSANLSVAIGQEKGPSTRCWGLKESLSVSLTFINFYESSFIAACIKLAWAGNAVRVTNKLFPVSDLTHSTGECKEKSKNGNSNT